MSTPYTRPQAQPPHALQKVLRRPQLLDVQPRTQTQPAPMNLPMQILGWSDVVGVVVGVGDGAWVVLVLALGLVPVAYN